MKIVKHLQNIIKCVLWCIRVLLIRKNEDEADDTERSWAEGGDGSEEDAAPAEEDPVAAVEPIGLTASAGFGAAATVQVCVLFSVLGVVSTAAVAEPEAPPPDSVDVEFAASGAPMVGPESLSL